MVSDEDDEETESTANSVAKRIRTNHNLISSSINPESDESTQDDNDSQEDNSDLDDSSSRRRPSMKRKRVKEGKIVLVDKERVMV